MIVNNKTVEQKIDAVRDAYAERIVALMERIRVTCAAAHMAVGEVYEMCDEEFSWWLPVWRTHQEGPEEAMIDVRFELSEARSYGGEPEDGIAFGISIVEWGGLILGEFQPYNYTPSCWVSASDEQAVAERWEIMSQADVDGVPWTIQREGSK